MVGPAYRPLDWLRLHVALGTNAVSLGYRGGVSVIPWDIGPSLTVQAGQYIEGNANPLASKLAGAEYRDSATARRLGYRFASARVGVELGQKRFTFYLHGGVTYLRTPLHDVEDVLARDTSGIEQGVRVTLDQDPTLSLWIPSVNLGFLVYLV